MQMLPCFNFEYFYRLNFSWLMQMSGRPVAGRRERLWRECGGNDADRSGESASFLIDRLVCGEIALRILT